MKKIAFFFKFRIIFLDKMISIKNFVGILAILVKFSSCFEYKLRNIGNLLKKSDFSKNN